MPFNLGILKTRALTAVVFVIIMLAGIFLNGWCFVILFTFIHFGCWFEFARLMNIIMPGKHVSVFLLGLVYITLPIVLMIMLGFVMQGHHYGTTINAQMAGYSYVLPCGIIFSIWVNDTMAYIVGSVIGKTPFSKISPKKTWEGTIGGIIFCVAVISLAGWYHGSYSPADWLVISFLCAVFGTMGDLLESKFKRLANVKDSGSIMPGHGGFLDRFDSLLTATPFVWVYAYLFLSD